jgi:F0F1-type ATP synthase membrane subunit b/b'
MSAIDEDPVFQGAGEHESVHLIRQAIDVIANARPLPLSSSVRIEPEEILALLDDALAQLPDELRQARWLLKEREEFLAKVQLEADQLLDEARARAEKLVARQEIVRMAKLSAQKMQTEAEDESRRKKHEAEDWCDQQLARFEIVLDRTAKTVAAGREKLRTIPLATPSSAEYDAAADEAAKAFFDQDLS